MTPEQIQQLRQKYGIGGVQTTQATGSSDFESFKQSVLGQTQQLQEEPKSGLLEDLKNRFNKVRQIFTKTGNLEMTPVETGVQVVGQAAGGLFDVAGAGLRKIGDFISAATPDVIEEKGKEIGVKFLQTKLGQAGLSAIESGVGAYENWKKENPRAADNLEAVVNISSLLPIGGGAKTAVKEGVELATPAIIKKAEQSVLGAVKKEISKGELKDAIEVVKPYLNRSDKIQALRSGRGKGGFLGGIKIEPSKIDTEVAESVTGLVKKNASPTKNIKNIQEAIAKEATGLEEGIKQSDAIFNDNQLRSSLSKFKQDNRIIFGGDKQIENTYDAVIDEYFRILKTKSNNLSGALEARKEFDSVVKSKFPNIFSQFGGDNVRANAVQDVRKGVNEFIASKLPEGNQYASSLRKQNLMYRAIDNIAENNIKLISESLAKRAVQALRKNVVVQGLTGGILTAAALGNVITNPLVLGSLLVGGTVQLGRTVVTSNILRNTLKQAIKIMESKSLPVSDIQAIRSLIEAFDTKEEKEIRVKPIK